MSYVDYLPFHHLGRALACLGHHREAVIAFETSERHGAVAQGYLGVAYASLALDADPDLVLSERLISPRIRAMLRDSSSAAD